MKSNTTYLIVPKKIRIFVKLIDSNVEFWYDSSMSIRLRKFLFIFISYGLLNKKSRAKGFQRVIAHGISS